MANTMTPETLGDAVASRRRAYKRVRADRTLSGEQRKAEMDRLRRELVALDRAIASGFPGTPEEAVAAHLDKPAPSFTAAGRSKANAPRAAKAPARTKAS